MTVPAADPAAVPRHAVQRHLEALLAAQRGRLRRRFLWHGVSLTALLVAAAVLLFFLLDHSLRLPLPIRLLHTIATLALLAFAVHRFVRYPLRRPLAALEVAEVLERTFPSLHQRLVSAVQLQELDDTALRNQSAAMVDRLLAETDLAIRQLPLDALFDPRRPRQFTIGAAGIATLLAAGALLGPDTAQAFVLRHLGLAVDYPRQTYLVVELPPAGPELQREDRDGESLLLLPAGADLHVSVLARGVVPKEAFLDVAPLQQQDAGGEARAARSVPMTPRPGDRFRHVFRRLSGSFEFRARGGDDEGGDRLVIVRTIHPPQVATIRAAVRPPAYTGVAEVVQQGGAIEALIGSEIELAVSTTAAVASATMRFLESGRRIELVPTTIQDDSGAGTAYRGTFAVEASDRYEIELVGQNGLRNPNPGTYPISALQDYAPVGRWLLPDDESLLLLPTALLCVRLHVHDDFGVAGVELAIDRASGRVASAQLTDPGAGAVSSAVLTHFLEVGELLGAAAGNAAPGTAAPQGGGDGLSLQVVVRDIRAPEPAATELPRRIVQIVDGQQLAAAVAKAFRALRQETEQALELQADRRTRLEGLLAEGGLGGVERAQVLTGVEVGQGRIAAIATRLHTGLMRAFDVHLWNRLETSPNAQRVLDLYRQSSRDLREPLALDPAFYRELVRLRTAGTIGALETTLDPILAMVQLADVIAEQDAPLALRLCAEAQAGTRPADALQQALATQQRIEQSLQQLLLRLEEWNDFQDLIQEARALRDRQRDLQARTEEVKGK